MMSTCHYRLFDYARSRRLAGALLVALAVLAPTGVASAAIEWQTGVIDLGVYEPAELVQALTDDVDGFAPRHVVVQFGEALTPAERASAATMGLDLLAYLGDSAYFATVYPDVINAERLVERTGMTAVSAVDPVWKMQPEVARLEVPVWASLNESPLGVETVALYVMFHRDVDLASTALSAIDRHAGAVRGVLESINAFVVEVPLAELDGLAAEDAVQWMEWPLPMMTPVNAENRARTGADILQAAPYNLDGSGVTVMVYDGGTARFSHVDFQGRLTVHDTSGTDTHPTHVAGTIGGAGVANANNKGMAPGVTIVAYGLEQVGGLQQGFLYTDPCDLEADYDQAIHTYGAQIANNSIGTNTAPNGFPCDWEGNYGITSNLIDTIVRGDGSNPLFTEPFRIVWANGNERQTSRCGSTYQTTAPPACAKNHITVGALVAETDAMSTFSSWGPADDDRLKPDISAPGVDVTSCSDASDTAYTTMSGTSMASPTTTGCAALILQDFRAQYPGEPDPRNSTLKTLFAHTAVDLGNTGPDYQFGYGSIRVQPAVDLMRAGNFLEATVNHGEGFSVLVLVEPGDPELKVTLAWDDYPGTPNVSPALVNDLDLRVFGPTGTRAYPWTLGGVANPSAPATRDQEDHINNIEQVLVDNPQAGVWTIEVYGFDVPQGPQPFSLCASPLLVACSSTGTIKLSSPKYACTDVAEIQVIDCDLNTDDNLVETTTVTIASNSEPAGESVLLTETGAATADFRGAIDLATSGGTGVLSVADGDAVTATYIDADDGQGNFNVPVTAGAVVDCTGPMISNVYVTGIDTGTATIVFTTNEPALGAVRYGYSCGGLTEMQTASGYRTSHSIVLSGLDHDTQYFFAVDAEDEAGNYSTDDAGGLCYSFDTPPVPDDCADAAIGCPGYYTGTTVGMTNDGRASCGSSDSTPDVWFKYTPISSGTLALDLCDSTYDTVVSVHTGCPGEGTELGCNDDQGWFGNCGWLPSDQSYLEVSVTANTTYYIRIAGSNGATGTYNLDISGPNCAPFETCDDGILNQGEDRIDCGGPCPPCECTADATCDDTYYCTGAEFCDDYGFCQDGADPCTPDEWCDEVGDVCVPCEAADFDCDGDVDLTDYVFIAGCLDGPDAGLPPGCLAADLTGDGVVDMLDIGEFFLAYTAN